MRIFKKLAEKIDRVADAKVEEVVAKEIAPRGEKKQAPPKPAPKTGFQLAAVLAAFAVLVACHGGGTSPSGPTASCDEPAAWCAEVAR